MPRLDISPPESILYQTGLSVQIGLGTAEISAGGFRCDASLLRLRDQTLIATVQCHLAAFDYTAQRVRRLPEKFASILHSKE